MALLETEALIDVLELLSRAYPDRHPGADTLEEYLNELDDIPAWLLKRAARQHIRESPWFPKICELRQRATKLAGTAICKADGGFGFLRPQQDDPLMRRLIELEQAFDREGRLDPDEWERLASKFKAADRPHRAERTLQRMKMRLGIIPPRPPGFLSCAAPVMVNATSRTGRGAVKR